MRKSNCFVQGKTPHADFVVEWDKAGNIVSQSIEYKHVVNPIDDPCKHLGKQVDSVECKKPCKGHVMLKVFACTVHGRCTIAKAVEGAQPCTSCPEYKTLLTPES